MSWVKNSEAEVALIVVETFARLNAIFSTVLTTSGMSGFFFRPLSCDSMEGSPDGNLAPQPSVLVQQYQPSSRWLLRMFGLPHCGQTRSAVRQRYFDSQELHDPTPSPMRK